MCTCVYMDIAGCRYIYIYSRMRGRQREQGKVSACRQTITQLWSSSDTWRKQSCGFSQTPKANTPGLSPGNFCCQEEERLSSFSPEDF